MRSRRAPLASITVTDQPIARSLEREFQLLRHAPELAAEGEQFDAWLAAPPHKTLALVAEMDDLTPQTGDGPVVYACPMHPEVTSEEPGRSADSCVGMVGTPRVASGSCLVRVFG